MRLCHRRLVASSNTVRNDHARLNSKVCFRQTVYVLFWKSTGNIADSRTILSSRLLLAGSGTNAFTYHLSPVDAVSQLALPTSLRHALLMLIAILDDH
jgi:hypothetical protein